jgi:hypothetical protein
LRVANRIVVVQIAPEKLVLAGHWLRLAEGHR